MHAYQLLQGNTQYPWDTDTGKPLWGGRDGDSVRVSEMYTGMLLMPHECSDMKTVYKLLICVARVCMLKRHQNVCLYVFMVHKYVACVCAHVWSVYVRACLSVCVCVHAHVCNVYVRVCEWVGGWVCARPSVCVFERGRENVCSSRKSSVIRSVCIYAC